MKVLVTGAGGQLGRAVRKAASGREFDCIFTDVVSGDDIVALDVTDSDAVREFLLAHKVDAVVNCAAYTDVNAAEDNEEKASLINSYAPSVMAEAARNAGAVLVHISTDYVFGGQKNTPYSEDDVPMPLNAYARTKLAGEQAVKNQMF